MGKSPSTFVLTELVIAINLEILDSEGNDWGILRLVRFVYDKNLSSSNLVNHESPSLS